MGPVSGPCRVLVFLMVAHLEWNCSRLRKLMKLSPGPVSVHPSHVSCITLQPLGGGEEGPSPPG